uniref:Putative conserved secreted protein n=1 Tax=Ixodes ricinus TaxID=34613 RepID=A0A6B0UY81_IXORI
MFKLSFLIVFVLAGLCFGAGSEDVSSSADQGHSGQGPEISADGSSDNGDSSGDTSQLAETSGKQETKPQEEETLDATSQTQKRVGEELPDFLGDLTTRRSYASRLLSDCNTKYSYFKINERNITFPNCTYTCLSENGLLPPKENRIPTGMICNKQNDTCPETGDCPPLPLPSC